MWHVSRTFLTFLKTLGFPWALLAIVLSGCGGCGGSDGGSPTGSDTTGKKEVATATLSISPESADLGNVMVGDQSAAQSFVLTNSGKKAATAVHISFSSGVHFSLSSNDCGVAGNTVTLPAGEDCTFEVAFTPVNTGVKSDTVTATYHNGVEAGKTATASVEGEATPSPTAFLSFGPASRDFGGITETVSSAPQTFTLSNGGGVDATDVFIALTTDAEFSISNNTCGTSGAPITLPADDNCTFDVTFSPGATGAFEDTITATYHNGDTGGQSATASLDGIGTSPAALAFTPADHDYGDVSQGGSGTRSFVISNSGGSAATSTHIALTTGTHFSISDNTCGTSGSTVSVPAGGNCTFGLIFSPGTTGALDDTITVTYHNGAVAGQVTTADINGNGVTAAASLSFTPASHDFGSVAVEASSGAQSFTLSNTGTAAATDAYITLTTGTEFTISNNGCGTLGDTVTIPQGGSCTFDVTFEPGSAGAKNDTLTATFHDGQTAGQSETAALAGTGGADTSTYTDFEDEGSGTPGDPYVIYTAAQLIHLMATSSAWDKHFRLGQDIDLSGFDESNGVYPIGTWNGTYAASTPFTGTFDGDGHSIANLSYDGSGHSGEAVGLFGYVQGPGEVSHLRVTNASVSSNDAPVGLIAGKINLGAVIYDCHSSGTVGATVGDPTWDFYGVGGLVGRMGIEGTPYVIASSSSATINSGAPAAGGLVGFMEQGVILQSFATGSVTAPHNVGGLLGRFFSWTGGGLIKGTYATGNVYASRNGGAGSLIGHARYQPVIASFATGNTACDTTHGSHPAGEPCGRLIGYNEGMTLTETYYSSSSSCSNTGGQGCANSGTSADPATFESAENAPLDSWDFSHTWEEVANGLPGLNPSEYDFDADGGCAAHGGKSPFAAGTGTLKNPYRICNAAQLSNLAANSSYWGHSYAFRLEADIDMSGSGGAGFPIGGTWNWDAAFSGIFDGAGHAINNLSHPLFGLSAYSLFRRVAVTGASVSFSDGDTAVGLLVNELLGGLVADTYSSGSVAHTVTHAGGIVGSASRSKIARSYSTATVTAKRWAGGIVGGAQDCDEVLVLQDLFSLADVTSTATTAQWDWAGRVFGRFRDTCGDGFLAATGLYHSTETTCSAATCNTSDSTAIDTSVNTDYFFDPENGPMTSWDFSNTWQSHPEALPTLRQD